MSICDRCSRVVIALALMIVPLGFVSPVEAQTTPILRLNCTPQNFPDCGWGARNPNDQYHRMDLMVGAGPNGQNAVQFTHLPATHQYQYYFGWNTVSGGAVSPGGARYLRLRIRVMGAVNFAGNQGPWQAKFFIIGDGSGDTTSRVIGGLGVGNINDVDVYTGVSRNIDGPPNSTSGVMISPGGWHSLQYELRSSTTSSSADGRLRIWIDGANSNYNSPTSQSGLFQLNTTFWTNVNLGYISQTTLTQQGRFVYQLADVEWDDQFDGGWHSGIPTPPPPAPAPSAPTSVRIIRAGFTAGSIVLLLPVLLRRRRFNTRLDD